MSRVLDVNRATEYCIYGPAVWNNMRFWRFLRLTRVCKRVRTTAVKLKLKRFYRSCRIVAAYRMLLQPMRASCCACGSLRSLRRHQLAAMATLVNKIVSPIRSWNKVREYSMCMYAHSRRQVKYSHLTGL